jgi:hypothetical protein
MAVIVISDAVGAKEVVRLVTRRLHNDIRMPEDCHGKQYVVRASFLKHADDEPRWSNEITFSMPRTTGDIARMVDQQFHDGFVDGFREAGRAGESAG